jgi:intracellular sulfur oxidation DsrE/DsrF family protein
VLIPNASIITKSVTAFIGVPSSLFHNFSLKFDRNRKWEEPQDRRSARDARGWKQACGSVRLPAQAFFEEANMDRRFFTSAGGGVLAALAGIFATSARAAEPAKPHRIALQISSADAAVMTMVLGNATNVAEYYKSKGETVQIEIVAFGPGYLMLRENSPMKARITEMRQKLPFIVFSACQNTRRRVAHDEGKKIEDIVELPEATDIPAGVVRLSELQEQGWSYVRS